MLRFSLQILCETCFARINSSSRDARRNVQRSSRSVRCFRPTSPKTGMSQQILLKLPYIKLREIPFSGSRVVSWVQTDRWTDRMILTGAPRVKNAHTCVTHAIYSLSFWWVTILKWGRDNSVSIATKLGAGRPRGRGSIPGRSKRFFYSP
jgi:hypothetical protein